jgi:hypothetical protein
VSSTVLQAFRDVSGALALAGVPAVSAYWHSEGERFYEHASARLLVEMVGRGGDKSRTSTIMSIAEVLCGDFAIPPGERHYFTHVSENVAEAGKTLSILEQYLRILKIGFSRRGDTIELNSMPRGFKVLACRVGAVSGWRCIGWTADECAKWSDEGADPSAEVIASIKAMTITHPHSRGRMFSTPVTTADHFYDCWSAGDSATQVTGTAPSWVANPSITEERARELEPHEPTRLREYGAQPGAGSSDALDPTDIAATIRPLHSSATALGTPVAIIDSSSGRHDGWSYLLARYVREESRRTLYVDNVGAFEGEFAADVSFDAVVAHVAGLARRAGAVFVYGDQHLAFALKSEFAKFGLAYEERVWTQPSKIEALSTLRRLLRERAIAIEPGEQADMMKKELVSLREVLLPSKALTVQARRTGRGHCDRASLALMLARCVAEGGIQGALRELGPVRSERYVPRIQALAVRFNPVDLVSPAPASAPTQSSGPSQITIPGAPGQPPSVVNVPRPPTPHYSGNGGRGWGSSRGFQF